MMAASAGPLLQACVRMSCIFSVCTFVVVIKYHTESMKKRCIVHLFLWLNCNITTSKGSEQKRGKRESHNIFISKVPDMML